MSHASRRDFLRATLGSALGGIALGRGALARDAARGPHFAPRARRVVWMLQGGAPSHVDLFDRKLRLEADRGGELPAEVRGGQRLTTMTAGQAQFPLLPSIRPYRRYGECGLELSSLLPHTGAIADRICVVRSCYSEAINHAPAMTLWLTGHQQPGRPSFGAWVAHALGSENDSLPAFVVLTSRDRQNSCGQLLYDHYWGSGFLSSALQGVKFHGQGDPVPYLSNPPGISAAQRAALVGDLRALNEMHLQELHDPEIEARTRQAELALRMQETVPELQDLSSEPEHVLGLYGPDVRRRGSFAQNCLLARRLLERGARCVQLLHAGWDQHRNLPTQLEIQCRDTDQPSAALVLDLAQRGLLEDTLVVWGGEFGRTPFCQGDPNAKEFGRDHHGNAFSIWLAGAGIRAGTTFGASDEWGYNVVDRSGHILRPTKDDPHPDAVHVHDVQATMLHTLGLDHERLTARFQGRDFRLTDVHGRVVRELLS